MPPKKSKKTPHNPFYFFMMDWKKDQISKGHHVPTALNLLAEAASPDWEKLSENERAPYKEKARIAKEDKTNLHNKFTADGKSYAQVYAEEKELSDFNAKMLKEITDTVTSISKNRKSLISHRFYLIHANHYCYWHTKSLYIPCEVAVAEYSIGEGVSDTIHFFPTVVATPDGRLPMGYLHDAQETAKRTHHVPLPPMDMAEDYESIAVRLHSFLQRSGTSELPPLYTQENNINCNNSMSTVKDFLSNCEEYSGVNFRTYTLPQLFYELRNVCANVSISEGIDPHASGFPTLSFAQIQLDRDIFHFSRNICCPYHEELSLEDTESCVSQFCSLSTVQRWCFLISDYCCKDVDVQLVPSKHCPPSTRLHLLPATNESDGWNVAGSSKNKKKLLYTDAPPPAENRWGKGPPVIKEVTKPTSYAGSTTEDTGQNSFAGLEASGGDELSKDDFPSLDGLRLPKTRGRGERLLAAINKVKLDAKEDFPALGLGRGRGRF